MENLFLKEMMCGAGSALTDNGAISYASTGTALTDQFGKCGSARNRDLDSVFKDQANLCNENILADLRFPFYLRMITRKTKLFDNEITDKVQMGQGAKDESIKRLLWLAYYQPDVFYKNLWILPLVGSWKDLWMLMYMDRDNHLKKDEFFKILAEGINDPYHKDLVKKYMPRIRSNAKCITPWASKTNELAKEFANFMGWSKKAYRQFKSTGIAHRFQNYICQGLYSKLNFNEIPGRYLSLLIKNDGKFFKKHNLYDKYIDWINKQPVAKFTGYVYELGKQCKTRNSYGVKPLSLLQKLTIDKQFDGLIELAKKNDGGLKGNIWCCLDTSGSMNASIRGTNIKCCDIANSLAVYFSTLNEGAFHKCILSFDDTSKFYKLSGSFTDMMGNLPYVGCGGTNFQGAIDEIIRVRVNNPNIPLEDYPKTLLVVSDMEFNPAGSNAKTNYDYMIRRLKKVFPDDFVNDMKFIWWHVTSNYTDFPSTLEHSGTYNISGFDGSIITLLLGGDAHNDSKTTPTIEELINKALSQEILLQVNL